MARSHNDYLPDLLAVRRSRSVESFPCGGTIALSRLITFAISIAALAASLPRSNLEGSARSIACATVSVVSTPKMIGTPVARAA
jgi:hypothetical protein